MATTLRDVAKLADVSIKTVSNVVSGAVPVSDATRARVESAIAELDYRPNLSARALRAGRSGLIALAVPMLSSYFSELAYFVNREAEARGMTLLIDQTGGIASRERQVLEGIRPQLVEGLIYSPEALGAREVGRRRDSTPMVLLGERVYKGTFDHVAIDNVSAARDAVAHLVSLGRTRIAAVGASSVARKAPERLRLSGYRQALAEAGLPWRDELVVPAEFSRAAGLAATKALLAGGSAPDAIFAFTDIAAVGVLRALHESGVRVPDDVAVIGLDDIEDGRYSVPTLSTIAPDKEEIASSAVLLLIARIQTGSKTSPVESIIPHRLVARESTVG